MESFNVDLSQFDGLIEHREIHYNYEEDFAYQHLNHLCAALTKRYGREIEWVSGPIDPYYHPGFIFRVADGQKSSKKGFDYTPFDELKKRKRVFYEYSKKDYSEHLTALRRRLSKRYKMRVECKPYAALYPESDIEGWVIQPEDTRYPRVFDDDLGKFRFKLHCYDHYNKKAMVYSDSAPVGQALEWYFYQICLGIVVPGYGKVRVQPNKKARHYFGRPKSFIEAFYDAMVQLDPDALTNIGTMQAYDDDSIWVYYHNPDDDFYDPANWPDYGGCGYGS